MKMFENLKNNGNGSYSNSKITIKISDNIEKFEKIVEGLTKKAPDIEIKFKNGKKGGVGYFK